MKDRLQSTKNYDLFELHDLNRDVAEKYLWTGWEVVMFQKLAIQFCILITGVMLGYAWAWHHFA